MKRLLRSRFSAGFSLVEVALSLGIVSFAMLSIIGLLPVGLKSIATANEQSSAANVLNTITESVRVASSTDSVNFSNTFSGQTIQYAVGGQAVTYTWSNLTQAGNATVSPSAKNLSAVVIITPPSNLNNPGQATISVAWSAQAKPTWDTVNLKWVKADGSITSGIQFLANP